MFNRGMTTPPPPGEAKRLSGLDVSRPVPAWRARLGHAVLGTGMLVGLSLLGYSAANDPEILEQRIVWQMDDAEPSDVISDVFEFGINASMAVGAVMIVERALHQSFIAKSDRLRNVHNLAHEGRSRKTPMQKAGVTVASVLAMSTLGFTVDASAAIGNTQLDAISALQQEFGTTDKPLWLISNTKNPQLSTESSVSYQKLDDILATYSFQSGKVAVAPIRTSWQSGRRLRSATNEDDSSVIVPDKRDKLVAKGGALSLLALSMPSALLDNREPAPEDCSTVEVSTTKELGVKVGEKFQIEDLVVTVGEILDAKSGVNLIPVVFSNGDFARCLATNPDAPYSFLLTDGNRADIDTMLQEAGVNKENITERLNVVSFDQFLEASQQAGENNVDGIMLQTFLVILAMVGMYWAEKSRNELANGREVNADLDLSGLRTRSIAAIYLERATSQTVRTAVASMPVIYLFDASTNAGLPGASLGPNIGTFLAINGAASIASILSWYSTVGQELANLNATNGGKQP